ncbi:lipoyl protein ligase domain-containing protein [Luteolibacter sp. AS25]|uniref:lipoyl protein ligase domain-containing protein n=1 Tax=Luteolibacter sp. AS25 TaxID=3135776 RepID=UPI00398B018B
MAVDEWLMGVVKIPLLRIYGWDGEWGSLGYFSKLDEAVADFPGLRFVRRWTGGGIVDHREDWTYSLVIPNGGGGSDLKRGESYRAIHEVLSGVLCKEGKLSELAGCLETDGGVCFKNPVEFDVMNASGDKIAGAAQRRGKTGLLHQGSVASAQAGAERGKAFAASLAREWNEVALEPSAEELSAFVNVKYGNRVWLERC